MAGSWASKSVILQCDFTITGSLPYGLLRKHDPFCLNGEETESFEAPREIGPNSSTA